MVLLGIDPHKDTHTVVVVDQAGRQLDQTTVPARTLGHGACGQLLPFILFEGCGCSGGPVSYRETAASRRELRPRGMRMATHEEILRRLALCDEQCIESLLGIRLSDAEAAGLDPKTRALVRLAALIATGGSCVSYGWAVDAALTAGATADEIVGSLIAVAPISGLARVVAASPEVACAIGYDIDQAFEVLDRDPRD